MPAVYDTILALYESCGVQPKTIATPGAGPHNPAGMMMVASGQGTYICIGVPVSSHQRASGVALVPIADPGAALDICVAWRKKESSAAVLQFMDSVWEVFPHIGNWAEPSNHRRAKARAASSQCRASTTAGPKPSAADRVEEADRRRRQSRSIPPRSRRLRRPAPAPRRPRQAGARGRRRPP